MQVILTVINGIHAGRRIPISGPEFLIGRDPKCNLRPASNDVSREHCALVLRRGRVFLRDYGSVNGTILNRRMMVNGELQLEDGDTIEVGKLTFKVAITADPTPPPPTGKLGEIAAGMILHQEDTLTGEPDEAEEPSPEDTVMVSSPKLFAGKPRSLGDSEEVLCP